MELASGLLFALTLISYSENYHSPVTVHACQTWPGQMYNNVVSVIYHIIDYLCVIHGCHDVPNQLQCNNEYQCPHLPRNTGCNVKWYVMDTY